MIEYVFLIFQGSLIWKNIHMIKIVLVIVITNIIWISKNKNNFGNKYVPIQISVSDVINRVNNFIITKNWYDQSLETQRRNNEFNDNYHENHMDSVKLKEF